MKKVLYIATAFPRFEGDIITPWLLEAVRRIKERGLDVEVFTSSYKGLTNQVLYGIKIYRFRYFFKRFETLTHEETAVDRVKKGLLYKLLVIFYLIFGTIAIIRLTRKRKYDVIHTHWPLPHAIFGYFASKYSHARHILYFHGVELMWVRKELKLLRPFLKWAIRKADAVICNSSHTKARIKDLYDRDVFIIPSGQAAMTGTNVFLNQSRYRKVPNYVLFVGRLVERKGVKYLLEAFAQIANRYPIRLKIVGEGPELSNLVAIAKEKNIIERVDFLGKVNQQELNYYYQNATIFVLPAVVDSKGDTEGLGVVLIEALAYKLPVVASKVGGIVDIIKDRETGLLVPEKDSNALANAIMTLLENPDYARELAEKGYNYVNEKYNWDRIIDQLINVFCGCTKRL
ncbi:MAG: glycosyltransferase family 4 protein [candidate division WOR-3 bacterium]|nr:glycosyltransferase family 4 protein [candidate division WOR-3 bacterium]MCX7756749.1 glycosyltransferase family 4 protein [candidate division WOR-3 bacterium]MDW7987363.1 glycosyltransferase family 4 protein [candidate division WOR-3 bacterium]